MQPVLQLKNVKKTIGRKDIIKGITFDVYPGEVFGFLGPNGAGKTTTIRMLVGLMSITDGEVIIKGTNIAKNFEQAVQHIGGIVENPEMYKFLTGYQNLLHYARMVKGVTKERILEVTKLVGLEKRIHDKVKTYSLGMRQRLGVAQALLHSPSILILDEPTNGLDPAGIREVRDYVRKLAREEGLAVIVSSHLLSEMEMMCDRIGIIQNGSLVGVQKVTEFVSEEASIRVQFQVDDVEKALSILSTEYPALEVIQTEKGIEILTDQEMIPKINASLVKNEIQVYGIMQLSKSLEDRFLEVTGGSGIG
ncbi:ABC transporter ATP-binding protein [Fredinandcohnia sp. QZ13]|uniref:ABC transporter ATP-binding protein n=1 Tax=Fredinandcohnia sp. QZ13 TaxID=3073144 RepID=UPI0028533718|nr:ABC transporter ATP-binding protein [Fredinandcohnia sp. QZ13]MDR4889063.1 ABC transporter ATP-binding protein [Fredinandcohnia sp. QZ13]